MRRLPVSEFLVGSCGLPMVLKDLAGRLGHEDQAVQCTLLLAVAGTASVFWLQGRSDRLRGAGSCPCRGDRGRQDGRPLRDGSDPHCRLPRDARCLRLVAAAASPPPPSDGEKERSISARCATSSAIRTSGSGPPGTTAVRAAGESVMSRCRFAPVCGVLSGAAASEPWEGREDLLSRQLTAAPPALEAYKSMAPPLSTIGTSKNIRSTRTG